jgi:pSer/pThr/pTyr-binding forkhead associated (FHA) protein
MADQADQTGDSLWANGDMMFRVSGTGTEPDRLVKVRRAFAVIGRAEDADIVLNDRAVSARHAYLHLDHRGVYAIDLVTRTSTRINGTSRMVGWIRPGDWLDIAGYRVELLRIRINGVVVEPPTCDDDLLADRRDETLVRVILEPRRPHDSPWELSSELMFLGWSASCGIQVKDTSVARTHCALVRTPTGLYLVDLCGRQTWVEDQPVRGAAPVLDGDLITLGSSQFSARVEPPARPVAHLPQIVPRAEAAALLARLENPDVDDAFLRPPGQSLATIQPQPPTLPFDTAIVPAEVQGALLAWMMGTIQGSQGEVIRRQGEFQLAITQVLRQIQQDNATLLNAHLQRIESIDHELAAIRAELERRNSASGRVLPPPPHATPLRIARPAQPSEPATADETKASTTWLLQRVNQLEDESRSTWKDLLGRLSQSRRAT